MPWRQVTAAAECGDDSRIPVRTRNFCHALYGNARCKQCEVLPRSVCVAQGKAPDGISANCQTCDYPGGYWFQPFGQPVGSVQRSAWANRPPHRWVAPGGGMQAVPVWAAASHPLRLAASTAGLACTGIPRAFHSSRFQRTCKIPQYSGASEQGICPNGNDLKGILSVGTKGCRDQQDSSLVRSSGTWLGWRAGWLMLWRICTSLSHQFTKMLSVSPA